MHCRTFLPPYGREGLRLNCENLGITEAHSADSARIPQPTEDLRCTESYLQDAVPFCQSMKGADCSLLHVCREGFSLLFYGFGSKKALLESFAREYLTDGGAVVFNGYMQSLNIREILLKVASLLRVPRYNPFHNFCSLQ